MYAIQHRCMSLKVDISMTKLIYVIFEFVLRITIIYLTKHRCIHVRNFVRKKPPYGAELHNFIEQASCSTRVDEDLNCKDLEDRCKRQLPTTIMPERSNTKKQLIGTDGFYGL